MDNYEQKYKEALEKAREFSERWQCLEAPSSDLALEEIKEIFPELRESEDEKIRKQLITAFKSLNTIRVWAGIEREVIIDWLERQGKKEPISFASGEDGKIMNLIFSIIQNTSAHSEYFASDIKKEDCIEWLNSLRLCLTDGEE